MSVRACDQRTRRSDRAESGCGKPVGVRALFDSNELRLDRLALDGVPVLVDGPALLLFVFERALINRAPKDSKLAWARNVAGLLNELEDQTPASRCA
jgi:hypothetical protein